jgi:hypothetical protein
MTRFEYRVVPAPKRGLKLRGARTSEERFAAALMEEMNRLAAEGWEYLRADILPCEERQGLTGRTTVFQNMLVFRRAIPAAESAAASAGAAPADRMAIGRPAAAPVAAPAVRPGEPVPPAAVPLGPAGPRVAAE